MKLKHLDRFYREVQSIDIHMKPIEGRTPAMTLEHYDQTTANYDAQVTELRELALTDLLQLTTEQIQFHANRLQLVNERMSRFWKWFLEENKKHREGNFFYSEFMFFLNGYLKVDLSKYEVITSWIEDTQSFLHDLHDAVMYKQGGVKYLLYQIKEITGIQPKLAGTSEERDETEKVLNTREVSYCWLGENVGSDLDTIYQALCAEHITETSLSDFKAAFTGQSIGSFIPVRWASNNASELIYFILKLMPNLIEEERRMSYIRLKGCFVKRDGKPFEGDLKSLKPKVDAELSPSKRQHIDNIVNNLL